MTREEHLAYCKICLNRKFDPGQGLICALTDRKADFDSQCDDFKTDDIAVDNEIIFAESRKQKVGDDFTFGLNKFGIRNGIVAGILLLCAGLAWLIGGLSYGILFYYSFILIVFGIIAIIIGLINVLKRQKVKRDNNLEEFSDILDH